MKIKKLKAKIAGLEKILNAHKDDNREDVIPSGNDEDQLDVEKAFGGKKPKRTSNSPQVSHITEFVSRLR